MNKILKITGFSLLGIVVILLVLPFLFKSKLAEKASQEINNSLNAKVEIGDFGLSLIRNFPNFRFSLNDVVITGVDTFRQDTLCSLPTLSLVVDFWSVVGGDAFEIKNINLDQPRIHAHVLADGRANWDITKPDPAGDTAAAEPSAFHLRLKKMSVSDGYVLYDDASLGFKMALDGLGFALSGDMTADLTALQIQLRSKAVDVAYGGMTFLKNVQALFEGAIDMDTKAFSFTFKDNKLTLNELPLAFSGTFAMPDTSFAMDFQFKAIQSEFRQFLSVVPDAFTSDFDQVQASGLLTLDGFVKGLYNGASMPGYGLNLSIRDGHFKYPSLPKSADNIAVNLRVEGPGDPDLTVVEVSRFHVDLGGNPVDLGLVLRTPVSDPDIRASLKARLDLGGLKDVVPLAGQELNGRLDADLSFQGRMSAIEAQAFDRVQAGGQFLLSDFRLKTPGYPHPVRIAGLLLRFTPKLVELARFDLAIGKSDLALTGKMENFVPYLLAGGTLKGSMNLSSELLDLDELMPADSSTTTEPADTSALTAFEVPERLDVRLTTRIARMQASGLTITRIEGGLALADRKARLENLGMDMLAGRLGLNGLYDSNEPANPKADVRIEAKNLNIPEVYRFFPTLSSLVPMARYASGNMSASFGLQTVLDGNLKPVLNTLQSEGRLQAGSIALKGSAFQKKLSEALKNPKYNEMALQDLDVAFRIVNGNLEVKPFPLKMGTTRAVVSGIQNLDQTINYIARFTVPTGDVSGAGSTLFPAGLGQFTGKEVNFDALITGTVKDPSVSVGLKNTLNQVFDAAQNKVKEEVKKQVEQVKETARQKADQLLAEAQKKADAVKAAARQAAETIRQQADAEATKLTEAAKSKSIIEQKIAKAAAEKIRSTAAKKADQAIKEGDAKADQIMSAARLEADRILQAG